LDNLRFLTKFIYCRKGLETVSAVFMLLLMFAAIIGIFISYTNYNLSAKERMNIDHERSQEQIILTKQIEKDTYTISSITIKNTGAIQVTIRAVYIDDDGQFSFFDPSKEMDTTIDPGSFLTIQIDNSPSNDTKIIAATQRGTRTMDMPPILPMNEPPPPPDTNEFYMGPLLLKFDNFWFQSFKGTFDPNGQWDLGWVVDKGSDTCAWKINVTNIGEKDISINATSCFSTVPSGSTDYRSWFLWTEDPEEPLDLPVDQPTIIIFESGEKIYPNPQTCMVFLTFYGNYDDENNTPYAQTIPFEALTVK
jgi:hypothetical protein